MSNKRAPRFICAAAAVFLGIPLRPEPASAAYTAAVNYRAGKSPQTMVAADFNNDGRLDLATANYGGNTVSVLLGDGQGGFGAAGHFAAGSKPRSIAVGDFNNDGKLDLATANAGSGNITALLGNDDGTFQAAVSTPIADADPMSLTAVDFGGGRKGLVVGSMYHDLYEGIDFGIVSVLYSNGTGDFYHAGWYNVGGDYPADLAVADLNGDGSPDVMAANHNRDDYIYGSGTVSVLLGKTNPLYLGFPTTLNTSVASEGVAIGDFTSDGIPDLVVAGEMVDVVPGNGDGTFDARISHSASGSAHTAVAAADFNRDGKLDAVTTDAGTGAASVFLGRGDGTLFLAVDCPVGSSPAAVAAGDFNGDGWLDLAAANAGSNAVSVLLNDGAWPSLPPAISVSDATVTEGNTGTTYATFTVTLSSAYNQPVTVSFATQDGIATAGSDYEGRSGTLTFAPGETTTTVSIVVYGDTQVEDNESFSLVLSGPSGNAVIGDGWGYGTITNDDFPPPKRGKKK